jgi:hypothetical protein
MDMPRPRPPHLRREVTRHGNAVWYVRRDEGRRIRIRAAFGTPEFDEEYRTALGNTPRPAKGPPTTGTIAWLIARYQDSKAWTDLSLASRRQRQNLFAHETELSLIDWPKKATVTGRYPSASMLSFFAGGRGCSDARPAYLSSN